MSERDNQVSEITRRDVAKCFGDDLAGARNLLEMLRILFPLVTPVEEFLGEYRLEREIEQHMIRNPGDWTVEFLFERIGALTCSRDRFTRLIESALHPLARRGRDQEEMAERIGRVLRRDGYETWIDDEESGYPIFCIRAIARGVSGSAKNIIFASDGPKPEIGFRDAINNDIIILSNEKSCLIYDRPLRRDGLLWSELVEWWSSEYPESSEPAKDLGRRLSASLASDAERCVFNIYFRTYRSQLGSLLPALLPQVYLHYDPAIVKHLHHREALSRQRMDFLILLPNNIRIVVEVDGEHHFSECGKPSLRTYAKMVSADRDLRLLGYDVYRFGSNELVGDAGEKNAQSFLDRLWTRYNVK